MITYIQKPIEEGLRDVPYIEPNITLIIDQYTSDAPGYPELFTRAKSMKDVFMHFKPSVEVEFVDKDGNPRKEILIFNCIEDFEANGGGGNLVYNSNFLSTITRILKFRIRPIIKAIKL